MENQKELIIDYVLSLFFHVEHGLSVRDAETYVNNPKVDRKLKFKNQLAEAILNNSISPKEFERLTGEEFETQEEVNEFLINEIWKPLYGDEPIET